LRGAEELSSQPDPARSEGASAGPGCGSNTSDHPLTQLRQFTPARIALGRTGNSLPTKELLEFSAAHAMARDAVHAHFNAQSIAEQLLASNFEYIQVFSGARDRTTYLRRPDLGRQLDDKSREILGAFRPGVGEKIVFIIADGLSAIAPLRYAVRVVQATRKLMPGWNIGSVIIAEQARVALGDEIGEILSAEITVMLIGERPGLSSTDSLGIYLTYAPKPGRTDAERNCISNVRDEGTTPEHAAQTLIYLLANSRRLKLSGVQLKDESDAASRKLL
jgi:ethanolamine ammonia-lyase small subunit